jgi:uncharacterized protein DUF1566
MPIHMKLIIFCFSVSLLMAQTKPGVWQDAANDKIWASSDNGSGVSWSQAANYCRALTLGGFRDWRLPSIDELQQLVGPSANAGGYRITGPIKLTGWQWSSSPGLERGEAWALDFGDGGRASVVAGDSGLNRALCVHDPAKRTAISRQCYSEPHTSLR